MEGKTKQRLFGTQPINHKGCYSKMTECKTMKELKAVRAKYPPSYAFLDNVERNFRIQRQRILLGCILVD